MSQGTHQILKLITSSKEVRTVNLINLYTIRYCQVLKVTHLEVALFLLWVNLVADNLHVGSLSHTTHEQQTSADQSHLDSDGKVEDYSKQECYYQYDNIALGVLHYRSERTPSTHVVTYDYQHTSQTCHWDILGQRHQEQEYHQQHCCMHDTSYWGTSTIVDVGHCTCDGTCCRDTTEDRAGQVGYTLSDKFGVRVVAIANHTVGHSG